MKKPTYTNEDRTLVLTIDRLKATAKECKEQLDKLTPAYEALVLDKGELTHDDGKKRIYSGTFRESNELVTATLTISQAEGTIDWKAYALSIGGNETDAEAYRREGNTRRLPLVKRKKVTE